jgi:proliferating cell nuclear antigen
MYIAKIIKITMSDVNNESNDQINDVIYNNITEDQIVFIHTKKIQTIKSVIEALKEIFRDVNIKITPKVMKPLESDPTKMRQTGGLSITALNTNGNILVKVHLDADKFCHYKCCPPQGSKNYVMLGVNMSNLFKIIKFLTNEDELFLIYDQTALNELNLKYLNKPKNLTSNYFLNLLDLKEDNLTISKQNFDYVITMPSADFHILIKNMSVLADKVDIKFASSGSIYCLTFSCEGEFVSQVSEFVGSSDTIITEDTKGEKIINVSKNDNNIAESKDEDNIIQGVYELKSLALFQKCVQMCPTIHLYIKNDSPLVIKYKVADMGTVHLILSPSDDDANNDSDNDIDDDSEND